MTMLKEPLEKPIVAENPKICVCYDVYADEILESIDNGADSVEKISELTYACQGCGSCRLKIEALLESTSTASSN